MTLKSFIYRKSCGLTNYSRGLAHALASVTPLCKRTSKSAATYRPETSHCGWHEQSAGRAWQNFFRRTRGDLYESSEETVTEIELTRKNIYMFWLHLLQVRVLLVCVGISMSFGSLLVKTYRIFAIFQKAVAQFKKIVSEIEIRVVW